MMYDDFCASKVSGATNVLLSNVDLLNKSDTRTSGMFLIPEQLYISITILVPYNQNCDDV